MVAEITPEVLMWDEMAALFGVMSINASKEMKAVVSNMFNKFRYGSGSDFSDLTLNEIVKSHSKVSAFTEETKNSVIFWLKAHDADLSTLTYSDSRPVGSFSDEIKKIPSAALDLGADWYNGLAITIHGFQGFDISITGYKRTDDTFSGTLHFKYFDHFGLDADDHNWAPGFCDWYTLQHYTRFKGAYQPYIDYIEFDVNFSGAY